MLLPLWGQEGALLLRVPFVPFHPCLSTQLFPHQILIPLPFDASPDPGQQTCQDGLVDPEGGGLDGEDSDICRDFVPHCGETRGE